MRWLFEQYELGHVEISSLDFDGDLSDKYDVIVLPAGTTRTRIVSGLDPEQHDEMRALMQEHRPAQFERMGRLMNLREDLMAEMRGERPDPEEVQALHGRMAELHGEMMAERVRLENTMNDLLTDEQRQQLQQATPESDVDPEDHEAHH